jgi:adenosylmethionine-8-amino-7-oxononanoate aminotransferase
MEVSLQVPVNAKTGMLHANVIPKFYEAEKLKSLLTRNTIVSMPPDTTWAQGIDIVTNLLSTLSSLIFNNIVHGTFTIAGRYCEPEIYNESRTNTLQFLLHGATYTRDFVS